MSSDLWTHNLSFIVRYNNHFTGKAVSDELPVRLDSTFIRPVQRNDGAGTRQYDGTYRFIDLPSGHHRVRWLPALTDAYRGWVSFDQDLEVVIPSSSPQAVIERDLWPSPQANLSPTTTAIRGKLTGNNISGLQVRIRPAAIASTSFFTRSDRLGEFLYPFFSPVAPETSGLLRLQIEVDGGGRTVNGGEFIPPGTGSAFPAAEFRVKPGICSRIVFQVT